MIGRRWRSWAALLVAALVVFVSVSVWATARIETGCWSPGTDCNELSKPYTSSEVRCNWHYNLYDPVSPGSNAHSVYVGDGDRKSYGPSTYGYDPATVYDKRVSSDQSGAPPGFVWYDHLIPAWQEWNSCSDGGVLDPPEKSAPWKWWAERAELHQTNQPPTVSASASPSSGTAPLTVTYSASASDPDGDPLTYSWSNGATGSSTSANYTSGGTFSMSVTVSDGKGGTASASASVTVSAPAGGNNAPTVSASASPSSGTAPLTVTFSASASDPDGDPLTYTWSNGKTGSSMSETFNSAGTYTRTVTVSDGKGGSNSASATVAVGSGSSPPPPPPPTTNSAPVVSAYDGSARLGDAYTPGASAYDPDGDPWYWSSYPGGTRTASSLGTFSYGFSATDSKGATGWDSSDWCVYDVDRRALSVTLTSTFVVLPGGSTAVRAEITGTPNLSQLVATTSWGTAVVLSPGVGAATGYWGLVEPPLGYVGRQSVEVSVPITQNAGCGITYTDRNPFRQKVEFDVVDPYGLDDAGADPDAGLYAARLPWEDYIRYCLGTPEPAWCGIDFDTAVVYYRYLERSEAWYRDLLGPEKWRKLVRRIDRAFVSAGNPPSGLYVPPQ